MNEKEKNNVWYVPLEVLDMRYTKMQDKVTQKEFNNAKLSYTVIDGQPLSNKLDNSQFLNPYSTNYFKFKQLESICEKFNNNEIKDNDVFYFSDLWFPGIESIKYMAYFSNINIHIYGILHAGSFTDTDTVNGMKEWARPFEESIIKMSDGIFLGSEQTRQDLIEKFKLSYTDLNKLHVTGLAFDTTELEKYKCNDKEDIIIFPHRIHPEKQVELFEKLKQYFPDSKFIVTHELNLSKDEYFKLLAKSKVIFSASLQENFGYSVLEACCLDCMPVLPYNNTCYKYMYPKEVLYKGFDNAITLIDRFRTSMIDLKHIPEYYNDSVKRQVKVMKKENDL
jgi:glycosyltransferase involved in cell wall biosynthesis